MVCPEVLKADGSAPLKQSYLYHSHAQPERPSSKAIFRPLGWHAFWKEVTGIVADELYPDQRPHPARVETAFAGLVL
jgi:hypothetical protein